MAQVKLKSIALLTGGIFVLLFFHFVPVGLGNVTIVGKQNAEATVEATGENTAIANVSKQLVFEQKAGQANVGPMVTCSFDALYSVPVRTFRLKNLK